MAILEAVARNLSKADWHISDSSESELVIEAIPSGAMFSLWDFEGSVQVRGVVSSTPEAGWGEHRCAIYEAACRINDNFIASKVAMNASEDLVVVCDIPAAVASVAYIEGMVQQIWYVIDRIGPVLDTVVATGKLPTQTEVSAALAGG